MKRLSILTFFVVVLLSAFAIAESISNVIPSNSLWDMNYDKLQSMLQNSELCKVGEDKAIHIANQIINGYNMDVYYVFGKDRGRNELLSKVVYVLSDNAFPKEARAECRRILSEDIKERCGEPDSDTDAVTTWIRNNTKIEIGSGKFKKYKSTDNFSVGVIFSSSQTHNDTLRDAANLYHHCEAGDTGNDVKNIQYRLIELGYLKDQADGIYGINTKEAIKRFQAKNGLMPDGIASPTVQVALFAKGALSSEGIPWAPFNPVVYASTPKPTKTPKLKSTPKPTKEVERSYGSYVGNANTGKFHRSSCGSVKQMKDSNKVYFSSREETLSYGYEPCKRCRP